MMGTWVRKALGALAAVLVVAGVPALGAPAQAAITNGVINGTLTGPGGAKLSGIPVTLNKLSGTTWSQVTSMSSSATGTYSFGSLTDGSYRVCFGQTATYEAECFNDVATLAAATTLVLNDTTRTRAANAVLALRPSISGTVTVEDGSPEGIRAAAVRWDPTYEEWDSTGSTSVKADGTYRLAVPAGTYRLAFIDEDFGQVGAEAYPDATTLEDGADVTMAPAQQRTGIDMALAIGTSMSGVVTVRGTPVVEAGVYAYPVTAAGTVSQQAMAYEETDRRGRFDFESLRPGSYVLEGEYYGDQSYWGFWGDSTSRDGARRAVVHPGLPLTGIQLELDGPDPAWTQPTPVVTPPAPPVPPAPTAVTATSKASVKGTLRVGKKLTLSPGTYAPSTATVRIQWFAGKKAIKKATKTRLKITRAMRGKKISVRITVSAQGLTPYSTTIKVGKVKRAR